MPFENLFADSQTCARNVTMTVQSLGWLEHDIVKLCFDTLAIV